MGRSSFTSMCAAAFLLVAGCATTVSQYSVTAKDSEKYVSKDVRNLDYDTNTYVVETRGGGAIACVNIGVKDGASKGAKVEFFRVVRRNGKRLEIVFATGQVFQASDTTSWVKINDPEAAGVKIDHFVKLSSDQSKSPMDKVRGWLGAY